MTLSVAKAKQGSSNGTPYIALELEQLLSFCQDDTLNAEIKNRVAGRCYQAINHEFIGTHEISKETKQQYISPY